MRHFTKKNMSPEVGTGIHVGADIIKDLIHFFDGRFNNNTDTKSEESNESTEETTTNQVF